MAVVALRRLWLLFVVVFYARSSVALSSLQVLFDSTNFLHRDLSYHVEQPARITACLVALQEGQLLDSHCDLVDIADIPIPVPGLKTASSTVRQEKCTLDELEYAKSILLQTHNPELVLQLERATREAQERRIQEGKVPLRHMGRIDPDTYVTTETYHVCLRATCAWIRACRTAMSRGMAMALTRPPGHHATINTSNGFCIFNFAAAAALHVLNDNPNRKVTVLDWDVHYGQGVADILQHHPNARYVSLHQVPAFPYMGEKRGVEGMYQNILNIPVPAESTWSKWSVRAVGWSRRSYSHTSAYMRSHSLWLRGEV